MNKKQFLEIVHTRKKTIIVLFLLLTVDAGLYFYWSSFQQPSLDRARTTWLEKRNLNAGGPRDVATVFREGETDLARFFERMPVKKEFARFIGDLMDIAANNNLSVDGVSYKPEPVKGERLLHYAITLNVSGKYAGIKSFISDIERSREVVIIDSISINSERNEPDLVNLKLQLSVFFRMEAEK